MQSRAKVKGKGRKWVAFGAVTVVSPGWTGLDEWRKERENVGMWACGTEGGAEALDNAWQRADLRQSNVRTASARGY